MSQLAGDTHKDEIEMENFYCIRFILSGLIWERKSRVGYTKSDDDDTRQLLNLLYENDFKKVHVWRENQMTHSVTRHCIFFS